VAAHRLVIANWLRACLLLPSWLDHSRLPIAAEAMQHSQSIDLAACQGCAGSTS